MTIYLTFYIIHIIYVETFYTCLKLNKPLHDTNQTVVHLGFYWPSYIKYESLIFAYVIRKLGEGCKTRGIISELLT